MLEDDYEFARDIDVIKDLIDKLLKDESTSFL